MSAFRTAAIAGLVLVTVVAHAQSSSSLPFGLEYGMTRNTVQTHMKAMEQYRVPPPSANELAYVAPDSMSSTKNGLFVKFERDKLVEISSMKTGMSQEAYNKYMDALVAKTKEWINLGMKQVMADKLNAFYLYQDDRSYVSVSGTSVADKSATKSVTLTYSEHAYFKKTAETRK